MDQEQQTTQNQHSQARDDEQQQQYTTHPDIEYIDGDSMHYARDIDDTNQYRKFIPTTKRAEITYTTGQVAAFLGVTAPTLRSYATQFSEFLEEVEVTDGGHRRFTQKDIDTLRNILQIKDSHKYTMEQTYAFLINQKADEPVIFEEGYQIDPERIENLIVTLLEQNKELKQQLDENNEKMIAGLSEALTKTQQAITAANAEQLAALTTNIQDEQKLLIEKKEADDEQAAKILDQLAVKDQQINELKEQLRIAEEQSKKKRFIFF